MRALVFVLEAPPPNNDIKVKITHKRNLPIDEAAKVELALKLKGNISDEAYLRMFPRSIIPYVNEELDRLEETPDKELLMLFELANKAGEKVPQQFIAEALRKDPIVWARLKESERQTIMDALTDETEPDELNADGE